MTLTYIRSVLSAFAATCLFVSAQISFTSLAHAQTVSDNSDLVARHQIRLDTIDSELRDLRGVLETDLRSLRIQLDKLADTAESADLSVVKLRRELNQEIARLDDTIGIMEQRLRRTIELSSDIEFRVLRLEKRMETLIALNLNDGTLNGNLGTNNTNNSGNALSANGNQTGQAAAQRTVQEDTLAGGSNPTVVVTRDTDTGETVWTVDEDKLNSALQANNNSDGGAADTLSTENADTISAENTASLMAEDMNASSAIDTDTSSLAETAEQVILPTILPDVAPDEQFKFALSRALQREFEVAEKAFEEFRVFNPDHERAVDSLFWLGRVQLMQGQYERAAMTFTTFNSEYPNDSRIVETTLFIAESVAQFAEPEQACAIYASLPQLLDAPTENFTRRIGELADSAGCN